MTKSNKVLSNFVGGEVSPLMYGRTDIEVFNKAAAKVENFIVLPQGGARFRNGTAFVKNTKGNKKAWLIPYQFSDQQAFIIEATDFKFRFYANNGAILNTANNISGVTAATPPVVTSAGHGYSNGDEVFITGVASLPEVNGRFYLVAGVTANTFTLQNPDGSIVDTSFSSTAGTGGTVAKIYELTSPFAEADLAGLQWAQNKDTMYFARHGYKPRKIVRTTNTNWTISTPTLTADPFGADASSDVPGAVCFTDTGRLVFAGTVNHPETIWASKEPTGATTAFEDFTTGVNDTDALIFTLAPVHGRTDAIQWLANTSKYMGIGTYGSVRTVYGASLDQSFTPTAVTAKSINDLGCAGTLPVANGQSLFYVQRGGRILRSVSYDFYNNQYVTANRNITADHLTAPAAINRIVEQQGSQSEGSPDCIWAVRDDGRLLGLTFAEKEQISGWHKHYIGGSSKATDLSTQPFGKVLSIGVMLRATGGDQIWMVVERQINSLTVRSVEYFNDQPVYPIRTDTYTGDRATDNDTFENALYEAQKGAVHVDMAAVYDGSAIGSAANVSVTPDAVDGLAINITSAVITGTDLAPIITPTGIFTSDMVGREIWKAYDQTGGGGGRAIITSFVDAFHVVAQSLVPFDSIKAIRPGAWFLTASKLYGLNHLEGNNVSVAADGGEHSICMVANGSITLDSSASKCSAGLPYVGTVTTLNIDSGGVSGPAEAKTRNIYRGMVRYQNTVGAKFGTTQYTVKEASFREIAKSRTDRPSPLFSGLKRYDYQDTFSEFDKQVTILQDAPTPCTILAIDAFMTTSEG